MEKNVPDKDPVVKILQSPSLFGERRTKRVNILLVDDSRDNLIALEGVLSSLDQNLIKAQSGEEALKCLMNHEVAVILMDVTMPGMNGFETAALIRQKEQCLHTPIIFLTGVSINESYVYKGYSLGAVDYIIKPFVPEIIRAKVSALVDIYRKTEQIKEAKEALKSAYDNLELRIQVRTAELTSSNAKLRKEITQRKRVEAELARQAQDLFRSNEELEHFAYIASHDLQEPLRMIASYLEILESRYKAHLDQKASQYIGFAVEGATRMQSLINDLLNYSRVGTHAKPFQKMDCEALFEKAVFNLRQRINDQNATITHDHLPAILGDPTQFVELFQNLLGNAIKFHGKETPLVHVSARENEAEWLFSVRDNGIGIDKKYGSRLFVIFQRLHGHSDYPGNGIGLALCKKIVERHKGRIWFESEVGNGSTFYFAIPKISEFRQEPLTAHGELVEP